MSSTATASTGAATTSGVGGSPPTCSGSGGASPNFVEQSSGVVKSVNKVWGDGFGSVWVASDTGLYHCSGGSCATQMSPDLPVPPYISVAGNTTEIGLLTPTAIVTSSNNGMTWSANQPYLCDTVRPKDLSLTSGVWLVSRANVAAAEVCPLNCADCAQFGSVGSNATIFALPPVQPATFDVWAGSGASVAHFIPHSSNTGANVGIVAGLWGFQTPTEDLMFACTTQGLYRFRDTGANQLVADQLISIPCTALGGWPLCDGTANLWIARTDGAINVFGVSATSPFPASSIESVGGPPLSATSMFVDQSSIWIGTADGIYEGNRPNL